MSKFKWMPIGKVGIWTDKNNQIAKLDEKYFDEVVAATKPGDVNFVIEHPSFDKIGFGKPSILKRVGEFLFALPGEVNEDFKKAVNAGELPGRSMTIDKATKKLLNISFLPPNIEPAIEGLGSYSFSKAMQDDNLDVFILQSGLLENESHFAELEQDKLEFAQYEVSNYPFRTIKELFRNIKDFMIEKFGLETANNILPNYSIDDVGNAPRIFQTAEIGLINQFSKNNKGNEMKTVDLKTLDFSKADPNLKAAIEALQSNNQELANELATTKTELQTATGKITAAEKEKIESEVLQFCSSENIAKKILPADQKKAVQFLMAQKEKGTLEFSSADGKKESFDAYEFAKSLIEKLPDAIETAEFAKGSTAAEQKNLSDAQKVGKEIADYINK